MSDTAVPGYFTRPTAAAIRHVAREQRSAPAPRRLGLRTLIAITTVCTGIFSVLATAIVSVTAAQESLSQTVQDRLAVQSQRRSEHFSALLAELRGDVRLLSEVPPIQGLIRAAANQGIDPLDGSSSTLWQSRLQAIFRGILLAKPHYLQVRYIGLENGGMELVRVERDRINNHIAIDPPLQRKGTQHYVSATAALRPGQLYLSPIDLNREHGEIQQPLTPVLRAAVPIYDQQSGRPFGVLVVNLQADYFFDAMQSMKSESMWLALTNSDGEYLIHPHDMETFAFEHGRSHSAIDDYPALATVMASGTPATLRDHDERRFVDLRRISYGSEQSLGLIMSVSTDAVSDFSIDVAQHIAVALLAICLICIAFALAVAHLIARPINQLSSTMETWTPGDDVPPLPEDSYGEARALATVLEQVFTSLTHRNRELEATNRELDQFAYIASHDLQEPVRTVTSFAEMLRKETGNQLTPRSEKGLHYMLVACDRMRTLIQGLLEYSRIGHHADATDVSLQAVVDDVLLGLSATILDRKARIHVTTALPTMRLYDAEIRLLVRHLISNAIKFCPQERSPHIQLSAVRISDGVYRVLIRDNGMGIPANQQDRIFTIFQRAVGREDFEGTGIGLAHCRKIVDLHHGRIWIDASSPEGTVFAVELEDVP